jgi:formate dehydrogenase major subunit
VTTWAEQSGTYLNMDGRLQKAPKALDAPEGVLTSEEALMKVAETLDIKAQVDWKASLTARVPTIAIE